MQAIAKSYRRRAKKSRRRTARRAYAKSSRRQRPFKRRNLRTGGFIGIELKFLDCAWNGVTVSSSTDGASGELQPSSGCTGAISVPAQGNAEQSRDGRRYTIKSIWVSGVVATTAISDEDDVSDLYGYFFALVRAVGVNLR